MYLFICVRRQESNNHDHNNELARFTDKSLLKF